MQKNMTVLTPQFCMFADGAGISLSLHVPAPSEGERRGCGRPQITYRYTKYSRSFVVCIYIYVPQCVCLQEHDVDIRTYNRM